MNIERLDDGKTPNYKRERITLDRGEVHDCAGSTKKRWHGPGSFVRTTFPDGAREDRHDLDLTRAQARLGY